MFDMQFLWDYYNKNGGLTMSSQIFEQSIKLYLAAYGKSVIDFLDFEFKITLITLPSGKVIEVT